MYKEKTSVWWKNMLANKDNYFLEDLKKYLFYGYECSACMQVLQRPESVLDPQEL